jgi:hypothetical protein
MVAMSATSSPAGTRFSRRTLLAASAAGVAVLAAGCTSSPAKVRSPVTDKQAQALAAQVTVQVRALRAAAPGKRSAPAARSSASLGGDARAWLRGQVAATATSHATACLDQSGARAALLGSIAAGLRGQDRRLA